MPSSCIVSDPLHSERGSGRVVRSDIGQVLLSLYHSVILGRRLLISFLLCFAFGVVVVVDLWSSQKPATAPA